MNPTAVILAVILSLSVLSAARLYPSTAVHLRGPHDPAVNHYTDTFDRHVSFRLIRFRCRGRYFPGWRVGPRTTDHALSRGGFRMRVERPAEFGSLGDGADGVVGYTNGFGSDEERHHGHRHEHGHGHRHGHGVGGGFVERVWKFFNRF